VTTLLLATLLSLTAADSPAQKAKAALDETGAVVAENQTLTEFASVIKAKTRADVLLDQAALLTGGIDPHSPVVTVNVRDVKLRDGYATALAPLGLRLGTVGGTIVISTDEGLTAKQMRQRVSLTPGPAGVVLADLALRTGANIVLDPRQKKTLGEAACELTLSDVTLETAVRLAAEVSGFRAVRMGNVLFVTSNERAEKLRADADGPTPATPTGPGVNSIGELPVPVVPPGGPGVIPPPGNR
jgi:hypothetical protein